MVPIGWLLQTTLGIVHVFKEASDPFLRKTTFRFRQLKSRLKCWLFKTFCGRIICHPVQWLNFLDQRPLTLIAPKTLLKLKPRRWCVRVLVHVRVFFLKENLGRFAFRGRVCLAYRSSCGCSGVNGFLYAMLCKFLTLFKIPGVSSPESRHTASRSSSSVQCRSEPRSLLSTDDWTARGGVC